MLSHGSAELEALADLCDIEELVTTNGWQADLWAMTDDAVEVAIATYKAVLTGSSSAPDPVVAVLEAAGINLAELLLDAEHSNDLATRSDLTELVAASSLIAADGCEPGRMHMPNIPKMSRRKSDSGVDIFDVYLDPNPPEDDLGDSDHLVITSVKHTIKETMSDLRWKLVRSVTGRELSPAYMASQLRVLEGRLRQEGILPTTARRVYLFLRGFPAPDVVDLIAVGVVDPGHEQRLVSQLAHLPDAGDGKTVFRMVTLPGLAEIHERCP